MDSIGINGELGGLGPQLLTAQTRSEHLDISIFQHLAQKVKAASTVMVVPLFVLVNSFN
jgi:hypothetical protein